MNRLLTLLLAFSLVLTSALSSAADANPNAEPWQSLKPNEVKALARQVYLYAYPLVLMDITMRQATNVPNASTLPMRAPVNQFAHFREYPNAKARDVVRFNFDTLYSFAWLDLHKQPMILSVPDTDGRYYLMPMLDMWTSVFAVPGTRTTGNHAGNYMIAGPGWKGQVPASVTLIRASTPIVWLMGRTQTNGPQDYGNVHQLQNQYKLTPLSDWGQGYTPPENVPTDPNVDNHTDPLKQVNSLSGVELLTRFSELLKTNPPHFNDYPILFEMRRLGLGPDRDFDPGKLPASIAEDVNTAARDARTDLEQAVAQGAIGQVQNGWNFALENLGTYGTDYRRRAMIAMAGLGANLPADALYPNCIADADGNPTSGNYDYVLHFKKGQLPAVNAFWSLTMYDTEGFQVPNSIDRFAIGDRDKLKFNPDGSLDIYIQHQSPGADKESNWLPAPAGPFQVMMRMYSPKPIVLRDGPNLPPVRKVTSTSH